MQVTDRGPIPPDDLIIRIGVSADHYTTGDERAEVFRSVGCAGYQDIVSALPPDWTWAGRRVLDFGCGSGRILRWFAPHIDDGMTLVGCDVHEPTIAWTRDAYPGVEIYASAAMPPLPEPDGSFDLIYCGSVFSHLTDWAPWLLEMRRLLKPGGLLVASIHGLGLWSQGTAGARGEPWDDAATGLLIEHYGAGFEDSWGPAVYASEWWLREYWGRALEIVRYEPSGFAHPSDRGVGQALVAARRREDQDALEAGDLLRVSDDPRELAAAVRGQRLAYEEVAVHLAKIALLWRDAQAFPELWQRLHEAKERVAELEAELTQRS
ncbi:MAG TPA: class I SAM-dependent methyltransferase [Baekduia sp.]|uniref:class I SAM-dependent methyltransferase n=1 Tax=Baekduia sp. TaxID=2600305 RepID=UPI002D1B446A|nr:class I SAM-dependent methyltransferase [Baekduia sp.]HMJ36297.1 class I SAM-dependent methyltransferase [Baekduia sp.]